MKRIRSNRGGLYPTKCGKRAGYEDQYFEVECSYCKKMIKKSESRHTVPYYQNGQQIELQHFHWECWLDKRKKEQI